MTEPISGAQVSRNDLATLLTVLAAAHEPPMLVGCKDLLDLSIATDRDLHERLDAERPKGSLNPVGVNTQDAVSSSCQLLDRPDPVIGQDLGLSRQTMVETSRRSHMERCRLLVMEGAQALHRPAAGVPERHVGGDDVVDARPLADLRDVLVPDPAHHGGESTGRHRRTGRAPNTFEPAGFWLREQAWKNPM